MNNRTSVGLETPEVNSHAGSNTGFLALAAAAFTLAQTAVVPALSVLTTDLGASSADVGWVLTGYLIAAAILTPVFGRLGDLFGKKQMLLVALGCFLVGSVVAAIAPNVWVLVTARVIQGAGSGIIPLCLGIVGDTFPAERRAPALGLISATSGIGAGGGFIMGGLLVDHASWQWIFWAGAIMAVIAIVGTLRLPSSGLRTPGRVDVLGIFVLAVGLTAPLLALSLSATWGWDDARTLGLILGGLIILVGFVFLELRTSDPLIDMRVLARPTMLITNIAMLMFGAGMFGVFSLIPQIAQTPDTIPYGLGLDATGSGLLLLPGALAMLVASVLAGWFAARTRPSVPIVVGAVVAAVGLGLLAVEHGSSGSIIVLSMVAFIGIGLGMATMPAVVLAAAPEGKTGEATSVNTLVRSLGSSVGSQIAATVLATKVMTVAGHELPSEGGITITFWIVAGATLAAGIIACFMPHHKIRRRQGGIGAGEPVTKSAKVNASA
ncbi:MFS transporter [Streptomyces sp. ID03-2B]|uniref:MFS transporter n=1 Tax=Streptomyces caviscabies TaxID=90079 RepID=A0ABW2MF38_9ACTN|nr:MULTISPECIES: MFS transporter [unclassified Streptomyces]MCL6289138.1 MFS transporter [Streptomyces sp. 43Y-GA-1]MDX3339042.1 MFS transporter [Streptomyces sp. ME02-6979.5a]MDX3506409.1 MFS transporter [Streptomyces sp. ATCC51928]MDX3589886.1 MFS transporter [Streptomyces sp. ID03-2B]MDX5522256.1 MFS transporter [Streptomyces sp. DE06-01C]